MAFRNPGRNTGRGQQKNQRGDFNGGTQRGFVNQGRNQGEACYTCGQSGHLARDCNSTQCFTCGQFGHLARDCYASSNVAFAQQSSFQQPDNVSARHGLQCFDNSDDYDYTIGFGAISLMIQVIEPDCEYVNQVNSTDRLSQGATAKLDSCCTRHMTGYYALKDAEDFVVPVIFGNKQRLYSSHVGTLVLTNGVELKGCLFVPGLMWTLISESRIEVEGGSMSSSSGVRKIFDQSGKLIISARLSEHTYVIEPQSTPISYVENANYAIADATVANTADLWHCRLGHLNFQDMVRLKRISTGFDFQGQLSFCEDCATIKSTNKPYQNNGEKLT